MPRYTIMVDELADAQRRIAELERQLESARSLAVDYSQRLARIAEILTVDEPENECGCPECQAYRVAIGMDEA